MEAVRLCKVVEKDGEILLTELPCKKGQHVEMTLLFGPLSTQGHYLTARQLLRSGLIGLWKDRGDIEDSASYARQLRDPDDLSGGRKVSKDRIEEIKERILPILKRYDVKRAGIFGSVARGEDTEVSDIDILVEIEKRMSLLDFAGLKLELEEALGRQVDLGEYSTIKPIIKERILSEEISIL